MCYKGTNCRIQPRFISIFPSTSVPTCGAAVSGGRQVGVGYYGDVGPLADAGPRRVLLPVLTV